MATATAHPDFNLISSEDVEGTTVYDPSGNEIGKMDHLMIDKPSGQVRYAIMSFGGFLGLGHSHYPLPWSSYDKQRDGYTTNVTADCRAGKARRSCLFRPSRVRLWRYFLASQKRTAPEPLEFGSRPSKRNMFANSL